MDRFHTERLAAVEALLKAAFEEFAFMTVDDDLYATFQRKIYSILRFVRAELEVHRK